MTVTVLTELISSAATNAEALGHRVAWFNLERGRRGVKERDLTRSAHCLNDCPVSVVVSPTTGSTQMVNDDGTVADPTTRCRDERHPAS
jgi:hypothetical protein